MSHPAQQQYCEAIKQKFPLNFNNCNVLDVGSLNINGCNRELFTDCSYTGIDVGEGDNVDIVTKCHEYDKSSNSFDTIISTECFEHDNFLELSLHKIIDLLKPNGLFLFTCATTGRPEHGTRRTDTYSSPLTSSLCEFNDYYKNLTEQDFRDILDIDSIFKEYEFNVDMLDIRFYGVKNDN